MLLKVEFSNVFQVKTCFVKSVNIGTGRKYFLFLTDIQGIIIYFTVCSIILNPYSLSEYSILPLVVFVYHYVFINLPESEQKLLFSTVELKIPHLPITKQRLRCSKVHIQMKRKLKRNKSI